MRRLTHRTARMFLVALAGSVVLTGGMAWAVTFSATLEGAFPLQITQGQTVNDAFAVRLTASGNFPADKNGEIIVCNAVTLNADGTATCTNTTAITIQNGKHSGGQQNVFQFPQEVQVSVTASAAVACNQTYNISLGVQLDATGGADFGTVDGVNIREVALPFDVQVACAGSDPQGCSLGYWKNHTSAWETLDPEDLVGDVFVSTVNASYNLGEDTLLQALSFQGGSTLAGAAQNLLRQAVAAVLNAYHSSVEYPRTVAEIVYDVNNALNSGNRATILSLAAALDGNNNLGCPLE